MSPTRTIDVNGYYGVELGDPCFLVVLDRRDGRWELRRGETGAWECKTFVYSAETDNPKATWVLLNPDFGDKIDKYQPLKRTPTKPARFTRVKRL
jgi:hypothetical protein